MSQASMRFTPCPSLPAEPGSAVVVLMKENSILLDEEGRLPRMDDLPETIHAFRIGYIGSCPCHGAVLAEQVTFGNLHWQDTRSAMQGLPEAERIAAGRAKTLLFWQDRRKFCGVCGTELEPLISECARKCPRCGAAFFPVLAPAMIVAVRREDRILLAHNARFKPGIFSVLAGFVEAGESVEEAVFREVREEVNIEVRNIRYFGSQSWPYPNSLMLGFEADYAGGELVPDGEEITDADWFSADDLPSIPAPGSIAYRLITHFQHQMNLKS